MFVAAITLLTWTIADPFICIPNRLIVWTAHIGSAALYTEQHDALPPMQTSFDIPQDPEQGDGAVIAWRIPVAVDERSLPLGSECQPTNLMVDGQSWEGAGFPIP